MNEHLDQETTAAWLFQRMLDLLKKSNEIQREIAILASALEMCNEHIKTVKEKTDQDLRKDS